MNALITDGFKTCRFVEIQYNMAKYHTRLTFTVHQLTTMLSTMHHCTLLSEHHVPVILILYSNWTFIALNLCQKTDSKAPHTKT